MNRTIGSIGEYPKTRFQKLGVFVIHPVLDVYS